MGEGIHDPYTIEIQKLKVGCSKVRLDTKNGQMDEFFKFSTNVVSNDNVKLDQTHYNADTSQTCMDPSVHLEM